MLPILLRKTQLPAIFHQLERWVQRYTFLKSRQKWKEACKSFLPYQSSLGNSFHKSVAKNRTYLLIITQGKREASSVIIDILLNCNEMKLMKTNAPAIFQLSQSFYSKNFKTIYSKNVQNNSLWFTTTTTTKIPSSLKIRYCGKWEHSTRVSLTGQQIPQYTLFYGRWMQK